MINASEEFKEKLKEGANVVNYADFTLSNGTVLHLEPKDFMIGGCTIEDKTTDGKFGVGFVIGKTLTLRIANHDERFSQYDFYNSTINLYVALALDDGTIEKKRKGVYYTLVPETPGDVIEISAVDGMHKLDSDYSASATVYPATLETIITQACVDCGIPVGFRQFDNREFVVKEKPEETTYRQVVSWAAQIAGYNARIDSSGYMQLVWYNTDLLGGYSLLGGDYKDYTTDTIIYGGNFKDYTADTVVSGGNFTTETAEHIFRAKTLDIHTDDVRITGVKVTGDDEDALGFYGAEGYMLEVSGNPFVAGKEQFVAEYLGKRVAGILFRPFSAEILNNPLYEPYEVVRVSDRKGNTYYSILNSISYTIGGYTQVACEAEDPVRNGSTYVSQAAQAVVEARRGTENQLTEYDKAVQNMNELAMNALGFFETVETDEGGRRIVYMHDEPTLEESTIIYKRSIDGFFVSQDGGQSYTAGFDKYGNEVVNILYAIGIVADWIRSGRLECQKNGKTTFLADVDTGEVRIDTENLSWTSAHSSMTADGILTCEGAEIAGKFQTKEPFGTSYKLTEVVSGVIKGYYDSTQQGLLDLSANYGDEKRHASLKGLDWLHLQGGNEISFEIGEKNTLVGYVDTGGIHISGELYGNADTATVADTAGVADKLGTATKGSATRPIYLSAGTPTACTYTLEKSVPSNAVFTDTVYTLPVASSSIRGGVKIGYSANGKNYPVQLSNEQMYVNVPWTDTNTTYGEATTSAAGLMSAADKTKLDGLSSSSQGTPISSIAISDSSGANTGEAVSVSGGGDVTLKMPGVIATNGITGIGNNSIAIKANAFFFARPGSNGSSDKVVASIGVGGTNADKFIVADAASNVTILVKDIDGYDREIEFIGGIAYVQLHS